MIVHRVETKDISNFKNVGWMAIWYKYINNSNSRGTCNVNK